MARTKLFAALTGVLLAAASFAAGPDPMLARTIPMPGVSGRLDHLAYDPQTNRLFVAALQNGSLEAIDLGSGERIKTASGLKEPQGVAYVSSTRQVVVACGGDGTVHAYDTTTLEEKGKADVGEDADNIHVDGEGKVIVVAHSGALSFLDAQTLRKLGDSDVKLSGHPEGFQLEPGTPRMFVNVPGGFVGGGGEVAVADFTTRKVTAVWKLQEAGRNFPMALDAPRHRLFVGCRRSAKLVVIDTESGRVLASPESVGDADDIAVDARTGRVFVVGGDGAIDVFESKDSREYTRVASVKTAPGARTGLLVPERRMLYIAVPKRSGQQAEIREYNLPD